ncbi:MAG: hypothetical protein GC154_00650 [bacterium]|nr:hypothetical protein [bacterium]
MKHLSLILLACSASFVMTAAAAEPIQVLLITGDDVAPAHNWRECSAAMRDVLDEAGKFNVVVSEDPMILDSAAAISRYDVIVLAMFNKSLPTLSDQAKQNLLDYVKSGKGFVPTHLSSASFGEWDEFGVLCGRKWVMGTSGHGPRSVFKSTIADKNHPITKGLSDFETDDELYAKLQGDTDIHVLVEAASDWSGKTEPLAFILEYGKGRVYHHAYGHDGKAIKTVPVKTLFTRGVEWAATGKVSE